MSAMPNHEPPYTIGEVAARLACSQHRVLQLIADRHLKVIQLGTTARTMRIEPAELQRFIDEGGIGGLAG